MDNITSAAAAAVRAQLDRIRLSQRRLAPLVGLSQQALSDRLTGKTPFTLADLERIAAHLGVPVTELLEAPASVVDEPEADR